MRTLAANLSIEMQKAQREEELRKKVEEQSARERDELISDLDFQHKHYETLMAAETTKMNERLDSEEVLKNLVRIVAEYSLVFISLFISFICDLDPLTMCRCLVQKHLNS